jgi:hypothetical protein
MARLDTDRGALKGDLASATTGRKFIASSLKKWLVGLGIAVAYIEKGQPQRNCFVERFNGTVRAEKLDSEDFDTLLEARIVLQRRPSRISEITKNS